MERLLETGARIVSTRHGSGGDALLVPCASCARSSARPRVLQGDLGFQGAPVCFLFGSVAGDEDADLALQMVVVTPEAVYTEASGHAFLAPFEAVLETVVEKLNSLSMITTQEKELARRGPGRAYVLSDK